MTEDDGAGDLPILATVVEFAVSEGPPGGAKDTEVRVVRRDEGRWAVLRHGLTLNRQGGWEREPAPSARTEAYLGRCRFDLETALRLARGAARTLGANA